MWASLLWGAWPIGVGYALFTEVRGETVRKGVGVTLRTCIWSVYRGQIRPNETVWVPCGSAFQVPPGLFRQFRKGYSPKFTVANGSSTYRRALENLLCGTPLGSKRDNLVAVVAPLCILRGGDP